MEIAVALDFHRKLWNKRELWFILWMSVCLKLLVNSYIIHQGIYAPFLPLFKNSVGSICCVQQKWKIFLANGAYRLKWVLELSFRAVGANVRKQFLFLLNADHYRPT